MEFGDQPSAGDIPSMPANRAVVVARHWFRHLLSFVSPAISLAFVLTGPHHLWQGLLFVIPGVFFDIADRRSPDEVRQPPENMPAWPFDAMLYLLFAVQVITLVLAAQLISQVGLFSVDALLFLLIIPGSSGFSIITAHELIHRREPRLQIMGRIMMGLVMYEHFYTEHLRGHHKRVGTPEDPATAHFGESFWSFYRRTLPGQFKSAWRLETARLGDEEMKPWDSRILSSRVFQGLVLEWAFAFLLFSLFGPVAFAFHLLQGATASLSLEVVNYFEHWGLVRSGKRVRPVDSWDTSNKFTLYGLVGLSRHADHHAYASRPFQQLRHWEESPKMPRGYPGMLRLVLGDNAKFQQQMKEELRRLGLGPFGDQEVPEH